MNRSIVTWLEVYMAAPCQVWEYNCIVWRVVSSWSHRLNNALSPVKTLPRQEIFEGLFLLTLLLLPICCRLFTQVFYTLLKWHRKINYWSLFSCILVCLFFSIFLQLHVIVLLSTELFSQCGLSVFGLCLVKHKCTLAALSHVWCVFPLKLHKLFLYERALT